MNAAILIQGEPSGTGFVMTSVAECRSERRYDRDSGKSSYFRCPPGVL